MASAIMHICIAKKVNEKLKKSEKNLLIGSIAPDICKYIDVDRHTTHFTRGESRIPKSKDFIEKYPNFYSSDYELGYYIHLLSDEIWFGEYLKKAFDEKNSAETMSKYENFTEEIYKDYINLNIPLIEYYNLDLKVFYEEFNPISSEVSEVPTEKLNLIVDEMGLILKEEERDAYSIIDLNFAVNYIDETSKRISNDLLRVMLV